MASDFKRYFSFLWKEANSKGLSQKDYMERCGLLKQSFTKYRNGQGITAKTMINLMEGIGMTIENIEHRSGLNLTKKEKTELTDARWWKHHSLELKYLRDHPEELEELRRKALARI